MRYNIPKVLRMDLASSYSYTDIAYFKEQRKYFASSSQKCEDRKKRKELLRYEKSVTRIINYLEGKPADFPLELQQIILRILVLSTIKYQYV